MKRVQSSLFLLLLLLIVPNCVHAQAWSGIIDPSRAVDWSKAGANIAEPTVQCGPTIAPLGSPTSPVAPTAISNAITACPSGQFVSLGAGTFYLSSGWGWWDGVSDWKHNVVVRGQGANSTFIVFIGSSVGVGNENSAIAIEGSASAPGQEQNVCDWSSGYSQGATTITLSNCGSTTPALGTASNLHVGSLLVLDQVDEKTDTGTIWNCAINVVCANSGTGGFTRGDGPCLNSGSNCWRSQAQGVMVTSVTTSGGSCTATSPCVGISPGLYMPNWRSSQLPQAWFGTRSIVGDALENMSIDTTQVTGVGHTISIMNCYGCWVSGVRSIDAPRSHVAMLVAWHSTVKDSYFYQGQSHGAVSYAVEEEYAWDSLIQNNICQQVTDSCPNTDGPAEGNVAAYNFSINDVYTAPGWFQASFYDHASGDAFNLREGNIGTGYNADAVHGTHHFESVFRNYLVGQQSAGCSGAVCTSQAHPVSLFAGARYVNIVGNVLGQAGFHTAYDCIATSTLGCPNGYVSIYNLGFTYADGQPDTTTPRTGFCSNSSCSVVGNYDPQVGVYLMRWGNYDTVSGSPRFVSSEVPTAISPFGNALPASHALPASFYLSAKPTWWGNLPYPAIGPDVTGGNIGNCTGGSLATFAPALATSSGQCGGGGLTASVVGGHANTNPAMNCYLNVMDGPANGTGPALSFNASTCYGKSGSATLPQPPTTVSATIGN